MYYPVNLHASDRVIVDLYTQTQPLVSRSSWSHAASLTLPEPWRRGEWMNMRGGRRLSANQPPPRLRQPAPPSEARAARRSPPRQRARNLRHTYYYVAKHTFFRQCNFNGAASRAARLERPTREAWQPRGSVPGARLTRWLRRPPRANAQGSQASGRHTIYYSGQLIKKKAIVVKEVNTPIIFG